MSFESKMVDEGLVMVGEGLLTEVKSTDERMSLESKLVGKGLVIKAKLTDEHMLLE